MAYAVQLTISTGNKVSLNYQSQEVGVTLCYQLEREDNDLMQVVEEKSAEVAKAHQKAWSCIRDAKVSAERVPSNEQQEQEIAVLNPVPSSATSSNTIPLEEATPEDVELLTSGQRTALQTLLSHAKWSEEQVAERLTTQFGCSNLEHLTQRQAAQWLLELQREEREKAQSQRQNVTKSNGTP